MAHSHPTRSEQATRPPNPARAAARAAAAAVAARRRRWTIASAGGAAVLVITLVAALAFGSGTSTGTTPAGLSARRTRSSCPAYSPTTESSFPPTPASRWS